MSKSIQIKSDGQAIAYPNTATIITGSSDRWIPEDETTLEELTVTTNGEYTPTLYGFGKVTVNVDTSVSKAEKVVTSNGTYNASDDGVDCYSKVTVNVGQSDLPLRIFFDGDFKPRIIQGEPIMYQGLHVFAEMPNGNIVDVTEQCEFSPQEGDYVPDSDSFFVTATYTVGE